MSIRIAAATLALCALLPPAAASAHARHAQCTECSPEQRDAFRTTEELVQRLWLQARRAHQSVKKEGATTMRVRARLDELRASFSDAWRAQEAFEATLDEEKGAVFEVRTSRAEDIRRRTLDSFDELEEILEETPPDQSSASWRFNRIARAMRSWIRQLDKIEWHAKM